MNTNLVVNEKNQIVTIKIDGIDFRPKEPMELPEQVKQELVALRIIRDKYDTGEEIAKKLQNFWETTQSENQRRVLKELTVANDDWQIGKDLQKKLGMDPYIIAGVMGSITKNLERERVCKKNDEEEKKLIQRQWSIEKYCWTYRINKKYKSILKNIINSD